MAAPARVVALTGADQAVRAGASVYKGFAVRETAGGTATIRIYDNATTNSGTLLDTIRLEANADKADYYEDGLWAENGVYVDIVSGSVEGSVRIG